MNVFYLIVGAILPVLIFIIMGHYMRKREFFKEAGWEAIEKLTYYILFPALIVHELAVARFETTDFLSIAVSLNVAQLMMFVLSFGAWFTPNMNGPKFTSVVQNNIRWNSYVALGVAAGYSANIDMSVMALAIASMIPTANILSVWSLMIWGKEDANKDIHPFKELFFNPLIIACGIGVFLQYFTISLPEFSLHTLKILGYAAMPLGLLAVGAGMDYKQMQNNNAERVTWALIRLLGLPICALVACGIFGVTDNAIILVILIATSAPTATNSYLLARQMGGDAPFMASLVGSTTLLSLATIPLLIICYRNFIT